MRSQWSALACDGDSRLLRLSYCCRKAFCTLSGREVTIGGFSPPIAGAWRSGRLPLFHLRRKLVVRHRNRVPAFTRIPAPRDQFVFRQVLDELIEVAILVLFRILNRTAKLSIREALPDHGCG